MAQVFFDCSNSQGALIHRCAADVCDLAEARDYAACLVQLLVTLPSSEDWRDWVLYISDDLGEEVFAMPFVSMLGKPH